MATIIGTSDKDVIVGTTAGDTIYGGDNNDRINGGAGDDVIYGEAGNDTLTGDAGNDVLYGGDGNDGFFGGGGNDTLYGEAGDDVMYGDGGNDVFYGGTGNNTMYGGTGDDVFHVEIGTGTNTIVGGSGNDRIVIEMTSGQLTAAALADLATLDQWMASQAAAAGSLANQTAQTSGATLTLSALGLTVSAFEAVTVLVDGVATPLSALVNRAPTAPLTAAVSVAEDATVAGAVGASDADGDALSYSVASGPAHGTLTLDAATGAYTYLGDNNFGGADSFDITVSDANGGQVTQHVDVTINSVADAPQLSVSNAQVDGTIVVTGGTGSDVLGVPGGKTFDLSIAAALTDTDGSESLSVTIAGVPAGATLSAGIDHGDGTWTLTGADLAGLTMTAPTDNDFTLHVTATATEAAGGSTSVTQALDVTFTRAGPASIIDAGSGNDTINGSSGNDLIYDGAGNDIVNGNGGDDTFAAGAGSDTYNGGSGSDTIDFSQSTSSTTVNLAQNYAIGNTTGFDSLSSIENIIGSSAGDKLTGNTGNNVIDGGNGDDTINGGGGNDTLIGGNGNDSITSGSGNDTIYDGAGNDQVNSGGGNDVVYAGSGSDSYDGGSGIDTLDYSLATSGVTINATSGSVTGFANDSFSNFEQFVGSTFADTFLGSKGDDVFFGGDGDDTIRGMAGYDTFSGGLGSDTYEWIVKDLVSGKKFLGSDTISDFKVGEDVLDLSAFTAAFSSSPIDDIVKMQDTANGTMVSVKVGSTFYDLVMLDSVHSITASALLSSGSIIA